MSKHTPGPWYAAKKQPHNFTVGVFSEEGKANICEAGEANAALIAAAPLAYSEFEKLIGIATDKSAPMGERLAYIETRCKIMLEKMRGES